MSMKKCIHTYDNIISVENLLRAWLEFKRGKTKKSDVQEFERDLMSNIFILHTELMNKTYKHGTYEHFVINDPKRRDIHKASVRDRLVHHAIHRVLYPYFDSKFIYDSYSCRVGKGTHRALYRFEAFSRQVSQNYNKQCWVLKCDIRKFFASIDHDILYCILEKHVIDRDVLWLIHDVVNSFNSGITGKGLPLGNLTSQLLVNIYMNEFDQYVKHELKEKYYLRYADDSVFLSRDKLYLEILRQKCAAFLLEKLSLMLHPDKVFLQTFASGVDFLGWVHFPHHCILRATSRRRMLRKIVDSEGKVTSVTSYLGLLQHGNGFRLAIKVNELASTFE